MSSAPRDEHRGEQGHCGSRDEREMRNAIPSVNCRIPRIIEFLNAYCARGSCRASGRPLLLHCTAFYFPARSLKCFIEEDYHRSANVVEYKNEIDGGPTPDVPEVWFKAPASTTRKAATPLVGWQAELRLLELTGVDEKRAFHNMHSRKAMNMDPNPKVVVAGRTVA
ncbi:hypothetical protein R1flu_010148 [Riccia fluitans]|uniref:Uncharacterized protein n=1 Tax=Riccia fluitans TaxID=41844 RepID=A0ABD1Z456_9MARC